MAGKLNTLSGRMIMVLLLVHAVLLPALFYGVVAVIKISQKNAFIDNSRIHARIFADILELNDERLSVEIAIGQLDSVILSGSANYAAVVIDENLVTSSLMDPEDGLLFLEDFSFGEHNDNVYYLSIPIDIENSTAVVRLGFDETPTLANIETVKQTIFNVLFGYLVISLLVVMIFGTMLVRPIQRLQQGSRAIASGDYERRLSTRSQLFEIQELASDLEMMRSNLVGANARLQKVIVEREAAEAEQRSLEARLRHSQRIESIGTLAGGVAHEFNNVLAPIVLYTDLALEDIGPRSPAREKLERVMDLAQRAKGLSQQILSFGSHSGEAERVAVDIAPVVEESLSLVRALVPATVEIVADVRHNLGFVLCDSAQVQQLVINLCSNAFRSLSKGGGHIEIKVDRTEVTTEFAAIRPRLRAGIYVVLSVRDTGEGIDSETLERIFEPFFTTQDVGKGTGLGLSVVHGIVVKHDGDIIVSSTPGRGSTFSVYFPIAGRQSTNAG